MLGPGHVGCNVRTGLLRLLGYKLGKQVKLSTDIVIHTRSSNIVIDTGSFINRGVHFDASAPIHIGQHCNIGFNTSFTTSLHNLYSNYISKRPTTPSNPIVIQDYVWLGCNVTVLGGVTIGHGSVVAAGSLVTKDIPPDSLAMGIPAKVVRSLKRSELITPELVNASD